MNDLRPKIIVIAGPTASGKTSLAVELALHLGGEVVNADSMQVYRGMDIGTAKPTEEEKRGVSHHLMDVVDPDEAFNAAIYRSLSMPVIEDLHSSGTPCFVVGGSGLYIRALLGGLFECPRPPEGLREALLEEWERLGPEVLHKRLEKKDSNAAKVIHPNDRVRVLRALEVMELTGRPFSSTANDHDFRDNPFQALKICLYLERDRLYKRINRRSKEMIEQGLFDETRALLEKGYGPELKPMQSIGYRHAVKYLSGEWDLAMTSERLQVDTRRYAKRQKTWFRGEPDYAWYMPEDLDEIQGRISKFYKRFS